MLTSEQVRAGRALLRMEQKELAERCGVSLTTIKRLETRPGPLGAQASTVATIETVFQLAGVEFLEDVESLGVRLLKDHVDPLA